MRMWRSGTEKSRSSPASSCGLGGSLAISERSFGQLTARERDIIDSRFGFERPAEKLNAIGSRLGMSAERVRQIEDRALAKMRQDSDAPEHAQPSDKLQSARSGSEPPANGRS
jgi:hypothetical protein